MNKLNINSLTSRSAAISLLGAGCASILLVFGIGAAVGQNSNELRSPSEFSATTLRKDHEPPLVIDGPFAEIKEENCVSRKRRTSPVMAHRHKGRAAGNEYYPRCFTAACQRCHRLRTQDCVVELVGLEPATRLLWAAVRVRSAPSGALLSLTSVSAETTFD